MVSGPVISTTPPDSARVGEEYVYQPRAFDAVVSGFTWSLEADVPGVTIDRHDGTVRWTPDEGGYATINLVASSVYGAHSRQSWTVCVHKAVSIKPSVENSRYRLALDRKRLRSPAAFRFWARPIIMWRVPGHAAAADHRRSPVASAGGRNTAVIPLRR